ncbi:hypothetical protein N431DRAFT_336514 [Stipitochalara longipes BDJ]|nr:hypothetical protein N431DRAFT_336514 [Stipitochalara longipes BDJ]
MASLLLRPLFRPQALGLGLGLSIATYHALHQRPLRLDSGLVSGSGVFSADSYGRNARTPVVKGGNLNPAAVRQISSGSIIGLCAGLVVSTFSRSLALILGLLVVGVQWASSYGIHIIPYNRLQKYVTSIDLRSAVQDNVAFKISFGTTFALAAFMQF